MRHIGSTQFGLTGRFAVAAENEASDVGTRDDSNNGKHVAPRTKVTAAWMPRLCRKSVLDVAMILGPETQDVAKCSEADQSSDRAHPTPAKSRSFARCRHIYIDPKDMLYHVVWC